MIKNLPVARMEEGRLTPCSFIKFVLAKSIKNSVFRDFGKKRIRDPEFYFAKTDTLTKEQKKIGTKMLIEKQTLFRYSSYFPGPAPTIR